MPTINQLCKNTRKQRKKPNSAPALKGHPQQRLSLIHISEPTRPS